MKVLTLINAFELGGIEKTFLSCVPYLQNKGVEVVVCCYNKQGVLLQDFEQLNVEIHQIKKTRSIFLDCLQMMVLLRKVRPDLVHSRFGFTSGGFCLASWFKQIPSIVSLHSTNASVSKRLKKTPVIGWLINLQLKVHSFLTRTFSTIIMGHSKANLNANYAHWEHNNRFRLLYNGIELDQEENLNLPDLRHGADVCILHVGSFREAKNHEFLVKTFIDLDPVRNNYRLIMVGDGALRPYIIEIVEKSGLSDCVTMPGLDTDLEKYFAAADLFYFPSKYEGFANVLVEAQYKGIPVCGADIAALYESVFPAYHPYFFDPANQAQAVSSLREMIRGIQSNEFEKEIDKARKFARDNFGIEGMANNLVSCYTELVKKS